MKADLARLQSETRKCEAYADRVVAHSDRRAPKDIPTHEELATGIALLDEFCAKCVLLFTARNYFDTMLPTFQLARSL